MKRIIRLLVTLVVMALTIAAGFGLAALQKFAQSFEYGGALFVGAGAVVAACSVFSSVCTFLDAE